jgi:NTP pyrophosphatase (non-canonical NTP hydrolase)
MKHSVIAKLVLHWAKTTFGNVAMDPIERALRMMEEAAEVAQGVGVPLDMLQRTVTRTYQRPVDDPKKEVGGLLVTVYALCARLEIDPQEALEIEVERILNKDPQLWRDKHNIKVADGTSTAKAP